MRKIFETSGRIGILFGALLLSSCSMISLTLHHNPPVESLFPTDEDVANCIASLSTEPTDSDAVLYNEDTDRYELRSDVYERALRDGIMYKLQKEKVAEFTKDYKEEKFGDAAKKDAGTALFTILLVVLGLSFL